MDTHWDVIVVGGGAAGLAAALMLGRSRRRTLVIDAGQPRNRFAAHMHGVLGQEGVDPAALLRRGREELSGYGVEVLDDSVDHVDVDADQVAVRLAGGTSLTSRQLVVATGITDELPGIPGLAQRWGSTVLHCPYCHGWEVRDRRLGVLTTTPLGLHQALLVRQLSDDVVVFTAGLGGLAAADVDRLRARGVRLVDEEVTEVLGNGDQVTAVRTADGPVVPVDAIFTAGICIPHDGFLAHLELDRTETPMGSFLTVDGMGRTSEPRIWAAGNVTVPGANVPMSIGAGTVVGAAVNLALVNEDFDRAAGHPQWHHIAPATFWEERYVDNGQVWSGRVNATVAAVVATLPAGTALDLGCGEGADVLWLARHGWRATGIDISPTAVARARKVAQSMGLEDAQASFLVEDLTGLDAREHFDLVTASFLHSPVTLAREDIVRRAADLVTGGGHLLVTSHAAAPPWADASAHDHRFLTPEEELETLALDPDAWQTVIAETRRRDATGPDGQPATLEDSVLLLRRR